MYNIWLKNDKNKYELNELIKMFLKPTEFQVLDPDSDSAHSGSEPAREAGAGGHFVSAETCSEPTGASHSNAESGSEAEGGPADTFVMPETAADKNEAKRRLFDWLAERTGERPDWGTLTGVRPAKLAMDYLNKGADYEELRGILKNTYYLNDEKIDLLEAVCRNQRESIGPVPDRSVGVYIGIPFCPTRCLYCSFTSNQAPEQKIAEYLEALHKEISYTAELMKRRGLSAESFYIGGGTPTTLSAGQLDELLHHVNQAFDMSGVKEFTVEAGRPDTITREKLQVIKDSGAERISINPQTMKAETLELIGRSHTPAQIGEAFALAKDAGIPIINADLITGLPGERPEDFRRSLETIIGLGPENITVHTLAVKKASRLIELDAGYHYSQGGVVREMLEISAALMKEHGYLPYYMYRQKHMAGNFENVGYAAPGTESIYNVRIMEENQTIVALGAGGISKVYFSPENRLERVPNVSNYEIYMERIDEMLERKEKGIL